MKYAIIKDASKQYKVSVGDKILIEKTDKAIGSQIVYNEVLLIADGDVIEVGTPTVAQTVTAKVLAQTKGEKIRVATYKSKSRLRKTTGHRHQYTQVEIIAIGSSVAQAEKKASPAKKVASAKPKTTKKTTK